MFTIKNKDSVAHDMSLTGPQGGRLTLHLEPGSVHGPFPESWRKYFEQNEVPWAVIFPQPEEPQEEPVAIHSIGAIETEPPAAEVKPRQYKKRSK
jgi:hypothetical protein